MSAVPWGTVHKRPINQPPTVERHLVSCLKKTPFALAYIRETQEQYRKYRAEIDELKEDLLQRARVYFESKDALVEQVQFLRRELKAQEREGFDSKSSRSGSKAKARAFLEKRSARRIL